MLLSLYSSEILHENLEYYWIQKKYRSMKWNIEPFLYWIFFLQLDGTLKILKLLLPIKKQFPTFI